jgi:hypothetical protein
MNYSRDPSHGADMAQQLRPSRAWRDPPPPRSNYREEPFDHPKGAAALRARNQHPGISPWLFVMATALNTMVAAVLAVIITLGVVRQEQRTDGQGREVALAAYTRPGGGIGGEQIQPVQPTQPAPPNPAPPAMDLQPIGSPRQPLLLEAQKPARLPLQISPEEAVREPFILALSGAPAGMTLSGADRIGSDTWFVSPGSANRLEITLPEWSTSVFEVTVALRRVNGLVAAQAKAWIAAPPPASPQMEEAKIDANAAGPTQDSVRSAASRNLTEPNAGPSRPHYRSIPRSPEFQARRLSRLVGHADVEHARRPKLSNSGASRMGPKKLLPASDTR